MLIEQTTNSEASLEIRLPETVAAQELQALLAIAQYVYSSELWLSLAENQPYGIPMPDEEYVPAMEDRLLIEHLEIGTPNKLTLKGRLEGITAVATLLTTLIGVPAAGITAYETYTQIQKNQAETAKILEETEMVRLQRQKAERLEDEGKITEQSRRYKEDAPYILAHYFSLAAPLLIEQDLNPKEY
jgi:hypothetical protein